MNEDAEASVELEDLLLAANETRRLVGLKKILNDFESVFQKLQGRELTIAQARRLFDALVEKYPTLGGHIAVDAAIVHSVAFEGALVKLSSGGALTDEEAEAVMPLLLDVVSVWVFNIMFQLHFFHFIFTFQLVLLFNSLTRPILPWSRVNRTLLRHRLRTQSWPRCEESLAFRCI